MLRAAGFWLFKPATVTLRASGSPTFPSLASRFLEGNKNPPGCVNEAGEALIRCRARSSLIQNLNGVK